MSEKETLDLWTRQLRGFFQTRQVVKCAFHYNLTHLTFYQQESYLMQQDEPGGRVRFSYKMSLQEWFGMLGIDRQRACRRKVELGADPGIFEG